uniref:DNA primase large subunit-like n=1 Tax=Vespula vulgaris TaxID=7454 RepID=UPI00223C2BB8|nr:DNA primase large subunit-like [Vespula vulgaris]
MHKVFLKHGMAFVPEKELAGLCFGYFKENLAAGLESIPIVAEDAINDPRINKIFNMLTEYIESEKEIMKKYNGPSLSELDDVSKKSYPLCMRIIHEILRRDHHLKHGERKQYSLFLKSIGVTADDAMELWKEEFTKKISETTFEREYGYRLRHIYGEGNIQKTYSSYKCSSIINFNIKPTESYGCPFKHLTDALLTEKLNEYKFVPGDIEDIITNIWRSLASLLCSHHNPKIAQETQVRSCYRMFAVIHLPKVPTIFKPSPCDLSVVRGDLQTNLSVEICGSSSI